MSAKPIKPIKKTGASQLRLDLHELRYQLIQADRIIDFAKSSMNQTQNGLLEYELVIGQITTIHDPLSQQTRKQALHRITPKQDYLKIALIALLIFFITAWYCAYTENELLQTEVQQTQQSSF